MSEFQMNYKDTVFRRIFEDKANLLSLYNAVNGTNQKAIDECIDEGILSDFLKKNKVEALEMSWYEYNEELHIKNERAIAYEEGQEKERANTEKQRQRAERAEQENERLRKEIEELRAQMQ